MQQACQNIQQRCAAHFRKSWEEREREAHEDLFFTEGLLRHVLKKANGRYASACLDCWRAYHNFRAHASD